MLTRVDEGVALYEPPAMEAGRTLLETTVKVDGEPVAVAYVALPTATWEALDASHQAALMAKAQDGVIWQVVSAETRVYDGKEGA